MNEELLQKFETHQGVVKKKRQGGIIALVDSSVDRWFVFRCQGRFFCYFNAVKAPVSLANLLERN